VNCLWDFKLQKNVNSKKNIPLLHIEEDAGMERGGDQE